MQLSKSEKTITCWLPKGTSRTLIEKLNEKGVLRTNASTARGSLVHAPEMKNGLQEPSEFEVLTVVVEDEKADDIFETIYFEGNVDKWDGGFIFMGRSQMSSTFSLPDVEKEAPAASQP